jgi:hypothetical protein
VTDVRFQIDGTAKTFEDMLTDKVAANRAAAGLLATAHHDIISTWLRAEAVAGTSPADILLALMLVSVSEVGSFAGVAVSPDRHEAARDFFKAEIDRAFVLTAQQALGAALDNFAKRAR